MTSISSDDESLLAEIAEQAKQEAAEGQAPIDAAEAAIAERVKQAYPETTVKPIGVPAEPPVEDEFALPDTEPVSGAEAFANGEQDPEAMTAAEATREPFESYPPQRIMMAEMQKAMLRSKLIVMHTFEYDKTPAGASILGILKAEKPEVYSDIIVRVAMALFIGWQKGIGQ